MIDRNLPYRFKRGQPLKTLKNPQAAGGGGVFPFKADTGRLRPKGVPSSSNVRYVRACLHEGGGLFLGEVTCGGLPYLTCKRDHIKMRDHMDRRVTPPEKVTSPTLGLPSPCKQALKR